MLLAALVLTGGGYAVLRGLAVRRRSAPPLEGAQVAPGRPGRGSEGDPGRTLAASECANRGVVAGLVGPATHRPLTPTAGVVAFALMMLCWLTDIAVLALAFLALHTPPPWAGLLLGLLRRADRGEHAGDPWRDRDHGGQHHAGPGGLRGAQTITLAAVMLYRLIAYWGCIPAGGLAWLVLRASSRAPTPPVASQANVDLQQPTRAPEPIP